MNTLLRHERRCAKRVFWTKKFRVIRKVIHEDVDARPVPGLRVIINGGYFLRLGAIELFEGPYVCVEVLRPSLVCLDPVLNLSLSLLKLLVLLWRDVGLR